MKVRNVGLMHNRAGLLGACVAVSAGIVGAYIVDDFITVLKRKDGTYSFRNHKGTKLSEEKQQEIISEIEKCKNS